MIKNGMRALALAALVCGLAAGPAGAQGRPVVEVAFVLDTTGSMGPLIEGAKRKVWSIATSIVEANPEAEVRMGLVAYRDIGDEYVTKTFDLTGDIQEVYGKLLELRAKGGGDWPESVNEALFVATTKLRWSQDQTTTKIMFLVGDAPPHMDYPQDTKYPEVVAMARERGIIVNAVQAGSARDTERVWRTIAQLGTGRYIPIPQDGGEVVLIETPFDREIIELQIELNRTIVPYGSGAVQERVGRHKRQIEEAMPAPARSDYAAYMNKRAAGTRSVEAVTGGGDLVADLAAGRQKLEAVKEEDLPEQLRAMAQQDRKAFLDKQNQARTDLNARMTALVQKREGYIADQRRKGTSGPKKGDSFDRAVEETIRAQVKR